VRSWPDPMSPWGKQLRFDEREFESMMDELRYRTGGDCFTPGKGIDVDLVLLRGIGVEADYVPLPDGVMGRTIFREDGGVRIEVSRPLAEAAETDVVARRRLRSTLGHEVGHVSCHSCLYIRDTETYSLFPDGAGDSMRRREPIMCRHDTIGQLGYRGEWWEYQANQCMAALLLPRTMFAKSVAAVLNRSGLPSFEDALRRRASEELVRALADEYDVSLAVTFFRLQALGYVPQKAQSRLALEV
jgi:hypothetical protein